MDLKSMEQVQKRLAEIRQRIDAMPKSLPTEEYKAELLTLSKESETLIRLLPALHVESIGDPAGILSDACRYLPDALKYIYLDVYVFAKIGLIKVSEEDRPALVAVRSMTFDRFSKLFENAVNMFDEAQLDPTSVPVLLEESAIRECIKNELLKYHLQALEGLPERKRLKVFIDQTLKSNPFIQAETTSQVIDDTSMLTAKDMLPVYHYSAFDRMPALRRSDFNCDIVANQMSYESLGSGEEYFSMIIKGIEEFIPSVPVNCMKLFILAQALFARQNPSLKKNKPDAYTVFIPVDWYIGLLRLDTSGREARRRIRNDLKTLYNASVKIRGKKCGPGEFRLIQAYTINTSVMSITFGTNIINFFSQLPQTKYALWLLQIGGSSANVYSIANKMVTHSSMRNNQNRGTNNKLSVASLLAVTDLPTLEDLSKRGKDGKTSVRKWKKRVKEPFEKALDELVSMRTGGLLSWHYARPGSAGKEISQAESDQLPSLQEYSKIMVVYELAYVPTYEPRGNKTSAENTMIVD